jgi:hypothetical protein
MHYRFNWEIYDKESGNTFRKERFYEQPSRAFASFNWARTEQRCVSAEIYRRGTPEHAWLMLASFVNWPLQAAIQRGHQRIARETSTAVVLPLKKNGRAESAPSDRYATAAPDGDPASHAKQAT